MRVSTAKRKVTNHPELDDLAEKIGEFIQYWGFKRIHGKIWAHLYLSEIPLDATTLVKRLKVSKALVSFSIHDLLEYRVIREVARGRGRTVLYDANPDVTEVILGVLKLRERKLMTQVALEAEKLSKSTSGVITAMRVSPTKLAGMREMIESAQQFLDFIIDGGGDGDRDMFTSFNSVVRAR